MKYNLNRRDFIKYCGTSLLAGSLILGSGCPKATEKKPNVILILVDDTGKECYGCYGGISYKTPNIDKLAANGMVFNNSFSTPLCITSRVQTLTGQYPFRSKWVSFNTLEKEKSLQTDLPLLPKLLQEAGYKTGIFGKWRLALKTGLFSYHPFDIGFDNYCTFFLYTPKTGTMASTRYFEPDIWVDGYNLEKQYKNSYGPDIYSHYLLKFIEENKETPFFAYYPMVLAHSPFHVPAKNYSKAVSPEMFGDMMAYMDKLVGDLITTLEKNQLLENTIIIFTSDNGTPKGVKSKLVNGTIIQGVKGSFSDVGTNVPMLVQWKNTFKSGTSSEQLTDLSDLLPTILELTHTPLPAQPTFDGLSIVPTLLGQQKPQRDWVYIQYDQNYCVRTSQWKYFSNGDLYNLHEDPLEQYPYIKVG